MKKIDPRKLTSLQDVIEKYRGTVPNNSFAENMVLGMNKSTRDLKLGMGGLLRDIIPEALYSESMGLPSRADVDVATREDAELMGTGGGLLGAALGNAALAAIGGTMAGLPIPMGAAQNAGVGAALGLVRPAGTEDSRLENAAYGGALSAIFPMAKSVVGKVMDKVRPKEAILSPEMLRALAHRPLPAMGLSGDDIAKGVPPHMIADTFKQAPMDYSQAPSWVGGTAGRSTGRMPSRAIIPDSVLKLNREFDDLMKQAMAAQEQQAFIDELSRYQLLPIAGIMGMKR